MATDPRADSPRRRRQEVVPAPEQAMPSPDADLNDSEGVPEPEHETAPLEDAGAPDGDARERSYQELFDAIPPEVLRAATEPLRPEELLGVCMDDRNPDDGVYSAGGLVLLDTAAAVEQARRLGITGLKSHRGCGAGAVLAQRLGLPAEQGDATAVEQSMRIAAASGIPYVGVSAVDPEAPHAAWATLVFVDIPARRSLLRDYLPQAFYISGEAYPDRETLIAEVLLSVQIGLQTIAGSDEASHSTKPFSVVMIGRDRDVVGDHAAVFRARMQAILPVTSSERVRVSTVF